MNLIKISEEQIVNLTNQMLNIYIQLDTELNKIKVAQSEIRGCEEKAKTFRDRLETLKAHVDSKNQLVSALKEETKKEEPKTEEKIL